MQTGLQSISTVLRESKASSNLPIQPGPEVILRNEANDLMPSTHLPVHVRLLDSAMTGAVLSGQITPSSCCRQPACSPLLACCDCTNPACSLCIIPNASGLIAWEGLRIDLAGEYSLVFFVDEPVHTPHTGNLLPSHTTFTTNRLRSTPSGMPQLCNRRSLLMRPHV